MAFTIVADTLPIFPTDISFGRPGGPEYNTDISVLESGHEQRNSFWSEPVYSWDVGYGIRTIDKIYDLLQFFHACRGKFKPFRFKDWLDYKSCDIDLNPSFDDISFAVATAGQTAFQLSKTYTQGNYTTTIDIVKPKGDTIRLGEEDYEVFDGWTIDEATGIITRATPLSGGEVITWGGEFYRKARFDVDKLPHAFEAWQAGGVDVPVIHLR
jgi:uncharacterized protein (TIGR02217 family)